VVAANGHDLARRTARRDAVRIAVTLNDEGRHGYRFELGEPSLLRLPGAARRLEWEREAEDADRIHGIGGATRDASAHRPTAYHGGKAAQLDGAQMLEHRRPVGVELRRAGRRTPAGDAVRLLDQRDADPFGAGGVRCGDEIRRLHTAGGSVTKDESAARLVDEVEVDAGRAVRSLDVQGHSSDLASNDSGSTGHGRVDGGRVRASERS
jgi:hypothetical protein